MKWNHKLGWMDHWCSMEVNMSLKECLLCWRGCVSCLKVKNSGSITDENWSHFHSDVFYDRSKLWVFRLISNPFLWYDSVLLDNRFLMLQENTEISFPRVKVSKKDFWAFLPLQWDCYIVSVCEKQVTQWHGFLSQYNKYLNKKLVCNSVVFFNVQ